VLKEQVGLDSSGIAARDWEHYPVLRLSKVPEVTVGLIDPLSDHPPLGVGEATAGPTIAAIGNAVLHALGARLRDLPLTRERVMAQLLAQREIRPMLRQPSQTVSAINPQPRAAGNRNAEILRQPSATRETREISRRRHYDCRARSRPGKRSADANPRRIYRRFSRRIPR